ncbi:MAG: MBL fold metallo-hydrolase [Bacteroidota bacterium]
MVKIAVSEKRNPIVQRVDYDENISIATWGAIKVNKSHFFPSSFQIRNEEIILYIDPVVVEGSEKADYILITHSHPDHFSIKDIQKLLKPETVVICSKGVSKKLSHLNVPVKTVKPGDTLQMDKLKVEATHAYNTRSVFLWIKAHPKSSENVGFIVSLDANIRIYHAGDTDYVSELKNLEDIDIAMVPVGGDNLTMNMEEAALVVNFISPKLAIPMHYEIEKKLELTQFKDLIRAPTTVKVFD